jgi:hypothetical protein
VKTEYRQTYTNLSNVLQAASLAPYSTQPMNMQSPYAQPVQPRGVRAPSGEFYIMVDFREDLLGQVLPDAATVRAPNGRWWRQQDLNILYEKSMLRCPTYGTCQHCLSSGPMNSYCRVCASFTHGYEQLVITRNGVRRMIDAEWVSRFFGRPHLPAMADRELVSMGQQSNRISVLDHTILRNSMRSYIDSPYNPNNYNPSDHFEQSFQMEFDISLFEGGCVSDEPGKYDRLYNKVEIIDPFLDKNTPLPTD